MKLLNGFSYVFKDPNWFKKVLIGSIVTAVPFVEAISDGYQIQTIKNIRAGKAQPLPEWDDISEFFKQGIGLRIAIYAIYIPTLITGILAIFLTFVGFASWFITDPDILKWLRVFRGAIWLIIPVIDLVVIALVPIVLMIVPAMARRIAEGHSVISLFNPIPTVKFIFSNFGPYVLSRVSVLAMLILAGFVSVIFDLIPLIGLFIGWGILAVARFWGRLMWAGYLGQMNLGKNIASGITANPNHYPNQPQPNPYINQRQPINQPVIPANNVQNKAQPKNKPIVSWSKKDQND